MRPAAFRRLLFLVVAASAGWAQLAGAQSRQGSIENGKRLAGQWCIQCHVIARMNYSGWTNAPSFPSIADRPGVTRAWLLKIIEGPHLDMLHMGRDPQEAADLAAYILSLRQK